ncbi:hypothetical protein O6H91_Y284000 [Diphasiastrum complanatum]|nr:hypothetical protein O6H91_Y284000 [Diphasiastrum complanatum]
MQKITEEIIQRKPARKNKIFKDVLTSMTNELRITSHNNVSFSLCHHQLLLLYNEPETKPFQLTDLQGNYILTQKKPFNSTANKQEHPRLTNLSSATLSDNVASIISGNNLRHFD